MAERSLSVRMTLKVADFIAGSNRVKSDLDGMAKKFATTAGLAAGFRRKLEDATKRLPKLEIDADSSPAEIKIAELRERMAKLGEAKVGVDVDAVGAMIELGHIQKELAAIDDSEVAFDVRAGVSKALADLAEIDREIDRVDGRNANVDVNVNAGPALANIALIGAALAALPSAVTIGAGVAGLGAAFGAAAAGAGAFGLVAIPAVSRVNQALQETKSAAGGAGGAVKTAGQTAAEAAQKALQLEQAERRVIDAKRAAKQAEQDLTQARRDARQAVEDLRRAVVDQALSEEDAQLSIAEAKQRLDEVRADPEATDLERKRAELSYRQAIARYDDEKARTKDLAEEQKRAAKAGVEGSEQVRAAKERLAKANADLKLAESQLKVVQLQQAAAATAAGGAAGGAASKFAELTAKEKILAKDIQGFQKTYADWQRSLEGDVFPAISGGLDLVASQLPRISPLVKTAGRSFVDLEKDAKKALEDPFWDKFLGRLNKEMPGAFDHLGSIAGNTFKGFAGVFSAFLPYTSTLLERVDKISQKFADWGVNLDTNSGFARFMAFAKENGPQVWQTIQDIATSVVHVVEALAPFGVGSLNGLSLLAKITAGMSPGEIQAVAVAVGAVYGAVKGGQAISAALGFLETLNTRLGNVKTTASGLGGKIGGALGFLGAGGPWGVAIGAGITALGLFGLAQDDAKAHVDDLVKSLNTQTGALTGNSRAAVVGALQDQGVLKAASGLGLSLKTVTDAALGNEDAIAKVDKAIQAATLSFKGGGYQHQVFLDQVKKVRGAISGENEDIADAREQWMLTNEALGGTSAANAKVAKSYDEAKAALDKANGSLDANTAKTGAQRQAITTARDKFIGYLQTVSDAARAQVTLTGKTSEGTLKIAEQLPQMMKLAGSNKAARDEVIKLAEAYGISREDAIKAAKGGQALKDVLDKIKSKRIEIDADTRKADAAIGRIIKTLSRTYVVGVDVRSDIQEHGNKRAAGGIDRYAAGGMRSMGPSMVNRPTVLFGEGSSGMGGTEAFIPYERRFRTRAEQLLEQVASDFGFKLIPDSVIAAAVNSGAVSDLLSGSADDITRALGGASSTMAAALGSSGTVTSSIIDLDKSTTKLGTSVSTSAKDLQVGVAVSTTLLKSTVSSTSKSMMATITALRAQIGRLESALAKAQSSGSTSKKSSTSTGGASIKRETVPRKKSAPQIGTAVSVTAQPSNLIEGHQAGGATSTHGGGSGRTLVINGDFNAYANQSPREIAEDLNFLDKRG